MLTDCGSFFSFKEVYIFAVKKLFASCLIGAKSLPD